MAKLVQIRAAQLSVTGIALAIGAVFVILFVWWSKGKIVAGAKAVGEAVNPLNQENIFNKAANDLLQTATGTDNSIGTALQATVEKAKKLLSETFTGKPWYYDPVQADKTRAALQQDGVYINETTGKVSAL
jgi:hypothetical protein